MLAAKSASPLICGLSKPVSRSSRSCSITAAMWPMPPVVERMKPSDPVEVEGIHNVSVTLLQILSGGELLRPDLIDENDNWFGDENALVFRESPPSHSDRCEKDRHSNSGERRRGDTSRRDHESQVPGLPIYRIPGDGRRENARLTTGAAKRPLHLLPDRGVGR